MFSLTLVGRPDTGFYLNRQLLIPLHGFTVANRCVSSQCLLSENVATEVLILSMPYAKAQGVTEFLNRPKLYRKLEQACMIKAKMEKDDCKHENVDLGKVISQVEEDFRRLAGNFNALLFRETEGQFGFSADIVKEMRSSDLKTSLADPLEPATSRFNQFFLSFRLRGYVRQNGESQFLKAYFVFVDRLRID